MPAQAPGERPAEGETVQEHDLEDRKERRERRDRRADDQAQRSPTKPKKETWLDLMPEGIPEPEVISHDELLDRLQARGINLKSSALQYYRHRGVLPRPIRRRHEGVTQPVYPYWFVDVIAWIKHMQSRGASLDGIRERIAPIIQMEALNSVQWADPLAPSIKPLDVALREYAKAVSTHMQIDREINTIRVELLDSDGNEVFPAHEVPHVPVD